jgi:hypothetical protein
MPLPQALDAAWCAPRQRRRPAAKQGFADARIVAMLQKQKRPTLR